MTKIFTRTLAAAAFAAITLAAGPAAANWTFGYDTTAGLVTATNMDGDDVAVSFTCRPPSGEILITDYTFGRVRGNQAAVRVGDLTINVPARGERVNRRRALVIPLPQSPPVLAAVREGVPMSVAIGGRTHELAAGAGVKLREVAQSCWTQ